MTDNVLIDEKTPNVFNPQRLEIVMKRKRLTPTELAKMLKMKSSRMHRICLGISEPAEQEIKQISQVLQWPIGWFYQTKDLSYDWCSI